MAGPFDLLVITYWENRSRFQNGWQYIGGSLCPKVRSANMQFRVQLLPLIPPPSILSPLLFLTKSTRLSRFPSFYLTNIKWFSALKREQYRRYRGYNRVARIYSACRMNVIDIWFAINYSTRMTSQLMQVYDFTLLPVFLS